MLKYLLLGLVGGLIALVLTPVVRAVAVRVGAVDHPGGRRLHAAPMPRLGGVAVVLAFAGSVVLGAAVDEDVCGLLTRHAREWGCLAVGTAIVVLCGVLDDVWNLGPAAKLGLQLVAGATAMAGVGYVGEINNPFSGGTIEIGPLVGVPLTLLWVVGITNAFNLIDGLDGLAAGVALIAGATLLLVSIGAGRVDVALLAAALAGALAGFLWYNFNPASIFLGDSGSLLLGYLLAVLSIRSALKGATTVVVLFPILTLGLPIMDTLLAMIRRLLGALRVVRADRERNEYRFLVVGSASIFRADRDHIHHRLLAMGLTHRRAVMLLYGVCAALGGMASLAVSAQGRETAALVGLVVVSTVIGIRKLGYQEVELLRRGTLLPLFDLPVLNRRALRALADAGFVACSYVVAFTVAYAGGIDGVVRSAVVGSVAAIVAAKLAAFLALGLYRRTYRYTNAGDLLALARCVIGAEVAAVPVVASLVGLVPVLPAVLVIDFYLTATLVVGARLSFTMLEAMVRRHDVQEARAVLIYGAGRSGSALLAEIAQHPGLGWRVAGFVDDHAALRGRELHGVPVLGSGRDLDRVIVACSARDVLISSSKITEERVRAAAAVCTARGVHLRRFRLALEDLSAEPAWSRQAASAGPPHALFLITETPAATDGRQRREISLPVGESAGSAGLPPPTPRPTAGPRGPAGRW